MWEPELLLVGRGSNTYFMQKYDNKFIKFVRCCYSGFFCDIPFLNVKMYLWLKSYTGPFFVSGQTYKISKGSNKYCSHCIYSSGKEKRWVCGVWVACTAVEHTVCGVWVACTAVEHRVCGVWVACTAVEHRVCGVWSSVYSSRTQKYVVCE